MTPPELFPGVEWHLCERKGRQFVCTLAGVEYRVWFSEWGDWAASYAHGDGDEGSLYGSSQERSLSWLRNRIREHAAELVKALGFDPARISERLSELSEDACELCRPSNALDESILSEAVNSAHELCQAVRLSEGS